MGFADSHKAELQSLSLDCIIDIVCGLSSGSGQGGFVVAHDVLRRLGEARIDLVLNLYPPEREDS